MRFLIFVVLMLGVTGIACAQMTDAQVIEAVKSAQAQGKSQDEIILMLSQKGVTKNITAVATSTVNIIGFFIIIRGFSFTNDCSDILTFVKSAEGISFNQRSVRLGR